MTSTAHKLFHKPQEELDADRRLEVLHERNHRVLIVEDEHAIAEAYRDILAPINSDKVVQMRRSSRSAGPAPAAGDQAKGTTRKQPEFELTVVYNAEAAIAAVKRAVSDGKPFTMGFFDVLLGEGMDGIELVKKILEIDPNLYAVFVTAYSDRGVDSIDSFLGEEHSNRWDYLNKPFTQGEILQKARSGVSLWNLRREKEIREEQLGQLQKKLLENERMTSVAAVARGVGHEFGNILVQIMGKAELGRNKSEAQMRESLEAICKASYRASEILDRFKFLANPSGQHVQKKWTFLHQPVDEALELLSHQLRGHRIKVTRVKNKKVPVFANPTGLMQVFVNLAINSIHAMDHGGQIDISICEIDPPKDAPRRTLPDGSPEKWGEIRFRDYGNGVDPKVLHRLTEPFFTTKGEKGTGLGLAITREVIEIEHQGRLTLRNHEVKGLEVVVQIPLDPAPEDLPAEGGQERANNGSSTGLGPSVAGPQEASRDDQS